MKIPTGLGTGEGNRGNPPVGPNEALMFDLKLVELLP